MQTKAFCNKCKINWGALWSDNSRHSIEFCPSCKTDEYLCDAKDEDTYVKSLINGEIYNVVTKEILVNVAAEKEIKETPIFNFENWRKKKEEEQSRQLDFIEFYHGMCDLHGIENAHKYLNL